MPPRKDTQNIGNIISYSKEFLAYLWHYIFEFFSKPPRVHAGSQTIFTDFGRPTVEFQPNLANLKVIIITGFPGHEKVKKLEDMGFANILSKPFDIQEFLQTVDLLLKSS